MALYTGREITGLFCLSLHVQEVSMAQSRNFMFVEWVNSLICTWIHDFFFNHKCHFIVRWNPWIAVVFAIILYAPLGLSRPLYIEIDSFSITWILGCNMEDQLKASYYMWNIRGIMHRNSNVPSKKNVCHTHLWTYIRKWKH